MPTGEIVVLIVGAVALGVLHIGFWIVSLVIYFLGGVYEYLISGPIHFLTGTSLSLGQTGEDVFAGFLYLLLIGTLLCTATIVEWLFKNNTKRDLYFVNSPALLVFPPFVAVLDKLILSGSGRWNPVVVGLLLVSITIRIRYYICKCRSNNYLITSTVTAISVLVYTWSAGAALFILYADVIEYRPFSMAIAAILGIVPMIEATTALGVGVPIALVGVLMGVHTSTVASSYYAENRTRVLSVTQRVADTVRHVFLLDPIDG